jgi:DNA processing protein
MAEGIDGAAAAGALTAGGTVVGVLGCGVDVVYPACNRGLFADVERHGCLMSEFPPGTEPFKWNFPRRNRIMSGLSNGVLVVEAPERSGALITARQAADQGRDVFVVPGNVDVAACSGSNALLEEAIPALSGWHVVRQYEHQYPGKVHRQELPKAAQYPQTMVAQQQVYPENTDLQKQTPDKKSIDKSTKSTYSVVNNLVSALTEQEQLVFARIGTEGCTVDDLIGDTELPPAVVKSILTKLTIRGMVRNLPGGRVAAK